MDLSSGFEKFCGGQFWNTSVTWDTPNPTLTNCSLWTVVAWLPCVYILLFAPVYFTCYLRRDTEDSSSHKTYKTSVLFVFKMILSIGLTVTSLSSFVYCCIIQTTGAGLPMVALVTPSMVTLVFIVSTYLVWKENSRRLVTSGFLSFFYFLLSFTSALFGYSLVWQYLHGWDTNIKDKFEVVVYSTFYILFTVQIVFMLVLHCLPDSVAVQILKKDNPNVCPELTMPFFARIVYLWIFRLLMKGYKKALSLSDLWTHFDGQDATLNRETFYKYWNKKNSLLGILTKMFGPKLLVSHASMACSIAAMFLVPFLLSVFIEFFDDPSMEHWKGILCSLSFFVNYVFESIAWQQMMYVGNDVGSRVKATLTSVTFHKILLLDTSSYETDETQETAGYDSHLTAYQDTVEFGDEFNNSNRRRKKKKEKKSVFPATPGEAVNLISTDIHNLGEATAQLHLLWAIPVETVMVLSLLWWLLSASVGVMVIIVGIALAAIFVTSRFLKSLQLSQLKHKDERIKVFTEVINGIKLLKLYTWEEAFEEKIQNNRIAELRSLKRFFYVNSINIFSSLFVPNLTTFATFSIYSWFIGPLTAKKAFTSMSLFNILQYQLLLLPVISSHFVKARVSLKRVEAFLQLPELRTYVESNKASPIGSEPIIQIREGTFTWDATCEPTLKNLNLTLNHKSLTAIVGLVGSGKSSVLSAILGEIRKLEGNVKVQGSVAYVSQQAWIQNATLRDNILFGMPYQENKYNKIVGACALKHDLDILTAGDLTVIGEKGINLSGGQKQRVSLARSLYQDCDVYLLDDPLSAVDSHVAKHIFTHVIGPAGYLKNKTRVLVTHAVRFLPYTDHVIVLNNGAIAEQGTYNDLSSSGGRLTRFIESLESAPDDKARGGAQGMESPPLLSHKTHARSLKGPKDQAGMEGTDMISVRSRSLVSNSEAHGGLEDETHEEADLGSQIISPESVGTVKFGAYKFYARQLGYLTLTLVCLFFAVFKSFAVMSNVWISYWTDDRDIHESFNRTRWDNGSREDYYERQEHYISSYGWFVAGHALFLVCYCITSIEGNTHASRQTHSSMLSRIIRAPISFFESTPTGRILNRFSRDLDVLDSALPDLLHQWLAVFTSLVSTIIIITMSIPLFFVVAVILVIVFLLLQHLYLPTARQLKWEESNSRSPIYALVCEALTGLDTIRAYQRQTMFEKRFDRLVNNNTILNFAANAAERWLGFHLEMMGAVTTFAASTFSLLNRDSLSGSTVGMFMSSSIQDSFSLSYLVRLNSSLETNMVSMERLKEYLHVDTEMMDQEAEIEIRLIKKKHNRIGRLRMAPRPINHGQIEFIDYSMRYRPDLDYSLRNINVLINSGEKVGIIGRTGAGKSSLISALFRFNLNVEGLILIDDHDTSSLPLKVLRSSMTVLPQDPIIFSGTIRMNLDPLSAHDDLEIWNALRQVKMDDPVKSLPGGLDFICQTDGLNFSVGQRQLLCLGRTLLHKTSILILDEATAAVDLETDRVIQETIRTQFSDCTVLTIAHRINTILSCDRIMLLDRGRVKEYSSPNSIQGLNGDTNLADTDKF